MGLPMRRFFLVLCWAVVLALAPSPALATVDLSGTWFVLIHYRDSMTANPDSDRWDDKVWKIEKKGSRLQWTEFPIVHFNDGSGRFGRVGRNPRARMLHKWEPNEAQMEEILAGPQVNSRGSKVKSLRGSPKRGYKSSNSSRSMSALTVGYQETWSIDEPVALPVFTRDDALGTESALATNSDSVVSGRTRYATLEISEDGNVLTGTYGRDENKRGTFQLIRAGSARGLETDGRSPNEKAQDRVREQIRQQVRDEARRRASGGAPRGQEQVDGGDPERPLRLGLKLPQVLAAVRAPSKDVNASIIVRKLEVVRLGADGVESIDAEEIESGQRSLSDEDDYGVLVLRYCRSNETQGSRRSWYLLPKNSLGAWDHVEFVESCAMGTDYNPAWRSTAGLERSLTDYADKNFPTSPARHYVLYERGLQLVTAGRVEEAEAMLRKADESVDNAPQGLAGSRQGRNRSRIVSTADTQAVRRTLERAIESAKQAGVTDPVVREVAYAGFLETLGDERVRDLREVIGEQKLLETWVEYERRILAGDEKARDELGAALREAYTEVMKQRFQERLKAGDPEAVSQMKEIMRKQRDRR
jgi:hypothetical protein